MEARVGHVTDARDRRPRYGIRYRMYSDVKFSYLHVQADNAQEAMRAFARHVGGKYYIVSSLTEITS